MTSLTLWTQAFNWQYFTNLYSFTTRWVLSSNASCEKNEQVRQVQSSQTSNGNVYFSTYLPYSFKQLSNLTTRTLRLWSLLKKDVGWWIQVTLIFQKSFGNRKCCCWTFYRPMWLRCRQPAALTQSKAWKVRVQIRRTSGEFIHRQCKWWNLYSHVKFWTSNRLCLS